jgi:peptide deformylase
MEILALGEPTNDATLRTKALPIKDIDDAVRALAQEMIHAMIAGHGVGLAAPQIGRSERIFVVGIDGESPRVFINPSIIETSQELAEYEEGCLSIPGLYCDVTRPAAVRVQAWNERGRPFNLEAEGFLARVILHEYDHLEGVLFVDRLSEAKKLKALAQYEKRRRM